MTTTSPLLPQATKHRFAQSEQTVRSLAPIFAPEAIERLKEAMRPLWKGGYSEQSPLPASRMVVQRLRAERLARGWTQKELAERSGTERANIARLETGRHSPRVDTLESLAKAMALSLADLFETGEAAAETMELSRRLAKSGVQRLKAQLRRMRELGVIDETGRRRKRGLPAEMVKGTSKAA